MFFFTCHLPVNPIVKIFDYKTISAIINIVGGIYGKENI